MGIEGKFRKPHLPSVYGISPHFLPRPKDYPADSHFTGFWIDESGTELDESVYNFINNGTPPLLLTFGSMPFESKLNLASLVNRITTELKTRVIIIKGWGLTETTALNENNDVLVLDSAPYDKLFPYLKAAVHHGGIGTVAACLKAGIPFLTCPVLYPLGDQHFWGMQAYKKGTGLKPMPLKKLNEEELIYGVKKLLTTASLYEESRKIADLLKTEDGVANAVGLAESL
jgi:sterol 3beta-glucosyltransferase